ncbi:tumor necrosis factor receptor superfamily member 13C isoform X1 [Moschus berezovskii]|uniref:tumor necrosis factor receptor superfamily member 13C isoform X1 n=1 Tax=Moschus berezovskii TaxID=68408 RepID=UPI002443F513|nr:tumor necrosis factor receptor superfamily member 13C isoform X1 [Moschus berezovskii]
MQRGRRGLRGKDRPAPTQCLQTQCFDPLVRNCVACSLLRTTEPRPASPSSGPPPPHAPLPSAPCSPCPSPPAGGPSSLAPGTATQPQESAGPGTPAEAEAALPLPALLFGAPALLGLALALALLGLVTWKRRRRRPGAAVVPEAPEAAEVPEAPDGEPDKSLDIDTTLSRGTLDATTPIWLLPTEDPAAIPPAHSVPVPATELGSTELVTTKTAGPELQ